MAQVRYGEKSFEWASGESLLDCLERNGVDVPSSCRSGACHSCLVKVVEGPISPVAQLGLKETWKQQNLCMSCVSTEAADVTVAPSDTSVQVKARVVAKHHLGRDVVRLKLSTDAAFPVRAGQFVNLTRPRDGLTRSYSVASIETDGHVELHVRVVPNGKMSQWVHSELREGQEVSLRGPTGDCFYAEGRPDQPLVLVGTGTGLAPLVGVARDALAKNHRGSITLIHGGRTPPDLYLDVELRKLAMQHPNFRYLPVLSGDVELPGVPKGHVDRVLTQQFPSLAGFRAFLCGSPKMVRDVRALIYKLGASLDDIFADAFIPAPPPKQAAAASSAAVPLPVLSSKPFQVKQGTPRMQKVRFAIQALIFSGFLAQAVLFYAASFKPFGSMLPFMAYDSLGHMVVSSTLVVWATLFLAVFIFGRFACGWLCPIGFLQDAGEKVLKALKVQLPKPMRQSNAVRFGMSALVLGHFVVMPVLAMPVRVWQFDWLFREPWLLGFPFRAGLFTLDLLLLFTVVGLVLPYFFGPRPYCKMVCETGYLFDLTSRYAFGRVRRNEGFERDTCLSCQRCSNICPQGINVFEEVHLFDRVVSSGCVSCMQCVNTCPNETIVYSLRKKAADTGRVVGYLAALQTKASDLPRYFLTGVGALTGAFIGFIVLPPSYFHTYAMFASLGGLLGFLVWRGVAVAFRPWLSKWFPEAHVSQVEKERAARLVPLSPEERRASEGTAAASPGSRKAVAVAGFAVFVGAWVSVGFVSSSVPPRIATLDELPAATLSPASRTGQFFLGVPTETSAEVTQKTYAGLREALNGKLAGDVRVWRADSYGALAVALEHEKLDAAFLPAASAHALLKRTKVHVIAQTTYGGSATYNGLLVARADVQPTPEGLRGARIALGQLDSLSGYLAPVWWLERQGVKLQDFGEVVFAANHNQAVSLLAKDRVDVAATFESGLEVFLEKNPDVKVQVLKRFNKLPNAVLVTRASLSELDRMALLGAMERIFTDPDAEHAREGLRSGAAMDGIVPATEAVLGSVDSWLE